MNFVGMIVPEYFYVGCDNCTHFDECMEGGNRHHEAFSPKRTWISKIDKVKFREGDLVVSWGKPLTYFNTKSRMVEFGCNQYELCDDIAKEPKEHHKEWLTLYQRVLSLRDGDRDADGKSEEDLLEQMTNIQLENL